MEWECLHVLVCSVLWAEAVSPLGRSGDAPPKRDREGFFFHTQSQCYASFHSSASGNIVQSASSHVLCSTKEIVFYQKKKDEVQQFLIESNLDFLALSETCIFLQIWLMSLVMYVTGKIDCLVKEAGYWFISETFLNVLWLNWRLLGSF